MYYKDRGSGSGAKIILMELAPEETKFNFNAARVFLTYPHYDTTPDNFYDAIVGRLTSYGIIKYCIGREKHPTTDSEYHIHAIFCLATKLHTRNARFFDIEDKHPNIRKVDNPERVRTYCKKDGVYKEDWPADVKGFRNMEADQDAFDRAARFKLLGNPFPFELPHNECLWGLPTDLDQKKRHWWFVGPADWGKTTWIEETFKGKRIYKRVESKYPFDDYRGQELIVYDDFFPHIGELLNVSNTYWTDTPVYGDTRYTKRYWPLGQVRVMIAVSNIAPSYAVDENVSEEVRLSFHARFNLIYL